MFAITEESLGKDNKNSSLLREYSARNSFTIWLRGKRWQPTPVFLPGKSHRQRRLVSYSPWGHKGVLHNLAN